MEKFMWEAIEKQRNFGIILEEAIDRTVLLGFYKLLNDVNEDREHIKASYQLLQYSENVSVENLIRNPTYEELEFQLKKTLESFPSFKNILKPLKKLNEKDFEKFLIDMISLLKNEMNFGEELVRGKYESIYEKFKSIFTIIESKIGMKNLSIFTTPTPIIDILDKILEVTSEETFMDPCFGIGNLAMTLGKKSKKVIGYDINEKILNFGKMLCETWDKTPELGLADSLKEKINGADVVASQIPFSLRGSGVDYENRDYLKWGTPSKTNEDFSFISLIVDKMKKRGAVLVTEGALFRGGAEGEIRKNLIEEGLISGIISLPGGILSLATSIIFFDKENDNKDVFIMDGKEYFKKLSRTTSITEENLNRLVQDYKERKDIPGRAKIVTREELEENGYTLNSNRYIEVIKEVRDLKEIEKLILESFEKALENRKICDKMLKEI